MYVKPPETVDIICTKEWVGDSGTNYRPDVKDYLNDWLKLTRHFSTEESKEVKPGPVTAVDGCDLKDTAVCYYEVGTALKALEKTAGIKVERTSDAEWKITVFGLAKYAPDADMDLQPVTWDVQEDEAVVSQARYIKIEEKAKDEENKIIENSYLFTNKLDIVDITGEKTWEYTSEDNETDRNPPKSIDVHLHRNGKCSLLHPAEWEGVDYKQTVEADDEGQWIYTFADLPKYDKNQKEYTYEVYEDFIPHYTSIHKNKTKAGNDIHNKYSPNATLIEVSKDWEGDDDNRDGKRPEAITVYLLADGKRVRTAEED